VKKGMQIEFKRNESWSRGIVEKIEKEMVYIEIVAAKFEDRWYYMGVKHQTPILLSEIQEYKEI